MEQNFWTISGWLIAFLSLIVNFLLLRKNKELNKKITKADQSVGDNSSAKQQINSGSGDNFMADRDLNVKSNDSSK